MSKNDYTHLLEYARRHLSSLDFGQQTGQRRFLTAACEELNVGWQVVTNPWHDREVDTSSVAYDFIDMLADADDADELPTPERALWVPLMRDWPLGRYAEAMADALPKGDLTNLRVLEIGAGVGNTTTRVRDRMGSGYVRTDLVYRLLAETDAPGTVTRWDFDLPWEADSDGFDLIFGTNAVHCARNPRYTVGNLIGMLRPGGRLMISEGCPYTPDPWALTAACGLIDGWWDRGGFLPPYTWAELGFQHSIPIYDGAHRVGCVYQYTVPES